ncbi:hypothetical protein PAE0626 [Pyrobaculum aerophilum str. IM2]|uniref:Endoribonuclease Nob1 n=2 Tax=Pyrobaculum aerophilum TaxID=13773 RepID=Q8ZYU0_PYRAE|nr:MULTISPECIES: NOB1 family endonuclease [Pyrobaculum]AAL62903.1 hypothetical protein PAE0626 [Pyrobaculum aerophilum str. IM2]HII46038.1 NOB1 family endonuclease [Pyrobaculum aerophilum]
MKCYALDASAFFHGRDARLFSGQLYTTKNVVEELKDPRAQALLEVWRVEIVEVDEKKVRELLKKYGGLSPADASVLILALERGCVLITDDGRLASIAKKLGVEVLGIFYKR